MSWTSLKKESLIFFTSLIKKAATSLHKMNVKGMKIKTFSANRVKFRASDLMFYGSTVFYYIKINRVKHFKQFIFGTYQSCQRYRSAKYDSLEFSQRNKKCFLLELKKSFPSWGKRGKFILSRNATDLIIFIKIKASSFRVIDSFLSFPTKNDFNVRDNLQLFLFM